MKTRALLELISATILASLLTGCIIYEDARHSSARSRGHRSSGAANPANQSLNVTFTAEERHVFRHYIIARSDDGKPGKGQKPLPPGLAKKVSHGGNLPPGWEQKLARGQVMPAEIYRECHPLPGEVVVRLPQPPPGTILVSIDGKVVRLARATMEILDVFDVSVVM